MNSLATYYKKATYNRKTRKTRKLLQQWDLYLLLLPGLLYFVVYKYLPMWGVLLSFKEYTPFKGFWASDWVGMKHFVTLLNYPKFWQVFTNTLIISIYNLLFYFPAPIVVALMLNEVRLNSFKRIIQSVIYLPHFISMVVVVSLTYTIFATQDGLINQIARDMGFESINFLSNPKTFRGVLVIQNIWKELGWGTIIFLAALTSVDVQLYEAATVDGANRWRQLWHITLPAIKNTVLIMLILRLGHVLDVGFEQVFLMYNPLVYDVSDVFETYIYREAILGGKFSFGIAVGLFKSVIGLALVLGANKLANKYGDSGIW